MANIKFNIDKKKIKEELEKKQRLELQKQLTLERKKRLLIMTFLLSALILTIVYGTLENPFVWTFSKIGNRFSLQYRALFIVWACYTGLAIVASVLALMSLEQYKNKRHYGFVVTAAVFLVLASLAPSLPEDLPFWYYMHLVTSGMFALFVTLGFYPFIAWVTRENPRLRRTVYIWLGVTWGGSIFWYLSFGNKGLFEMWFFIFFIVFLLYLSLTLFEEKIVKISIDLLRDEENLNEGIEKIFIDLDEENKKRKRIKRNTKKKQ
jgi:hypothetical protein